MDGQGQDSVKDPENQTHKTEIKVKKEGCYRALKQSRSGKGDAKDHKFNSIDSFGLSHDESFGVDDLDLNLNEYVDLNISQTETQYELPVFEVPVSKEPDGNNQEDGSAPSDGQFFYDVEGIDSAYETQYDVHSSEDADTYDDDEDDFLVDEENEIIEPDVDVHLFSISMDVPFGNIGVTNLVPNDILEGEDVDVINMDGFDSDPGYDYETSNNKRRMLAELSKEMEDVMNASGQ
ncbi:hypothetical protein Tco_0734881 [Tanacetum coccineum]